MKEMTSVRKGIEMFIEEFGGKGREEEQEQKGKNIKQARDRFGAVSLSRWKFFSQK